MEKKIINDCLNTVTFEGNKKRIKQALAYISGEDGFNSDSLGKEIEIIPFGYMAHTDWEPNITGVKRIADRYHLNFVMLYDDGVEMFGEVNYSFGEITIVELDTSDFEKLSFNDMDGTYFYNNKIAFERSDFFNVLLDEKICRIYHSKMTTSLQ